MARVARLILASLTIRLAAWVCSPSDYHLTPELAACKPVCEEAISRVIASVPYHLGWHTRRSELFANVPSKSGFTCGKPDPFTALPALFILWPLAAVC